LRTLAIRGRSLAFRHGSWAAIAPGFSPGSTAPHNSRRGFSPEKRFFYESRYLLVGLAPRGPLLPQGRHWRAATGDRGFPAVKGVFRPPIAASNHQNKKVFRQGRAAIAKTKTFFASGKWRLVNQKVFRQRKAAIGRFNKIFASGKRRLAK